MNYRSPYHLLLMRMILLQVTEKQKVSFISFKNQSFSGRMGLKLDANQQVDLSVLDNVLHAGYDAYGSLPPTTDVGKQHLQTLGLNWGSAWSELWTSRLGWTQGTDRYESSPSVYITQTQVSTYLFHNELKWGPGTMTADLERREDRLQNAGTQPSANTLRAQNALALGYGLKLGSHALQANARHDVNSQFGTKSTGALNYGYAITPEWRVTASAATAFRAPTLYQRFSVYGVASLLPETSNNKELGLRWASDRERASLVVYQNDVNNLINYVSGAGSCLNGVGMYAHGWRHFECRHIGGTGQTGWILGLDEAQESRHGQILGSPSAAAIHAHCRCAAFGLDARY